MPGVYSEQVTMKPYVDIEGSGELTTKITYTGSGSPNTGTVLGASNAELRFLSVENTGGAGCRDRDLQQRRLAPLDPRHRQRIGGQRHQPRPW